MTGRVPEPGEWPREILRRIPPQSLAWSEQLARIRREAAPPLPSRPRGLPPLGVRQWQPLPEKVLREVLSALEEL